MAIRFSRYGLAAGLAGAMCLPIPAVVSAQSGDDEVQELETFEVTGSRIRRVDYEAPTPVQVFDRAVIDRSGAATVQDFLTEQSFAGPGVFNETATLSQIAGSSQTDARGFGNDYTLVLLNGRRLPGLPVLGGNATDINQIPLAAVERIEFLSDGASAIYGSDAISGVINVITKDNFDGINFRQRLGTAQVDGGSQISTQVVGGTTSDSSSTLYALDYFRQNSIAAGERPLIRSAIAPDGEDGRSPIGIPVGFIETDFSNAFAADDCPAESIRNSSFTSGTECAYDFAPLYEVLPQTERYSLFATHTQGVTSGVDFFTELRYTRAETHTSNGAAPGLQSLPASSPFNEFGRDIFVIRRNLDFGNRRKDNINTTASGIFGLTGTVFGGQRWELTVANVLATNRQRGAGGQLSRERLNDAYENNILDPTSINSPEALAASGAEIVTFRDASNELRFATLAIDGFLPFSMGAIAQPGYAFGLETRTETYRDESDQLSVEGDVVGGAGSNGGGDREVFAAYGELSFPIGDILELSGALRYDDIKQVDSATTGKLAASLRPIDSLLFRASYATGFKAPALGELFLGRSFGVTRAVDTTVCNAAQNDPDSTQADIDDACRNREIRSVSGGNPDLAPEESKGYNFGVVFQATDNINFSVDYFNIEVDDKIGSLGVQEILNNEDQYPELVNRVGGQLSDPDSFVRSNLQNLTREEASGLDFVFNLAVPSNVGDFDLSVRATHMLEFNRQTSAIQPLCDDIGTTSEPSLKFNTALNWTSGAYRATLTSRYLGETEDLLAGRESGTCNPEGGQDNVFEVDDYIEFGAQFAYDFTSLPDITIGINNLLDEEPPYSRNAGGGWPWYDQGLYSNIGRFYYVTADFSFGD